MRAILITLTSRAMPRRTSHRMLQQPFSGASFSSTATNAQSDNDNATTGSSTRTTTDMNQFKERLAQAAMKQVPTHGWTKEAIAAAAVQDPKLSISMSGMLTPTDLVHWFMDDMNRQLGENRNQQDASKESVTDNDRVFQAIQWRLQQVVPLVQCGQWHQGMALGISTPLTTKAQLHEFIEIISPPNASTEYQAALGAIFVATELHLLTDSSQDYQDTWSFLQQRLDDLEANKDNVSPSQLLTAILPSPSNIDTSIPWMASMAVASSLAEGAASLLMPPSGSSTTSVPGTKASDYSGPSSSS